MTRCPQRYKLLLGIFKVQDRHSFIISNAFYTLEDFEQIDVVKTCSYCQAKVAFLIDKNTLLDLVDRFPNAFDKMVRGYLKTWMR